MCGRYFIADKDTPQEMQAILDALNRKNMPVQTGEIFPSDAVPVIARSRSLVPAPFAMRWGYALDGRRVINARSETAGEKPLFSDGMRFRRCLVPASGYYEWSRRSREKTKYEITDALSPMIYMAGLYRLTDGMPEFVILTRDPGESVSFLHDRMPVILPRECFAGWLNPACSAHDMLQRAQTALRPVPVSGQAQTLSFFELDFDS